MSQTQNALWQDETQWQTLIQGIKHLAQQEVLSRFEQVGCSEKADGSLLTIADTAMQQKTQDFLHENWPEYALLGEESPPEEQNAALQNSSGCWILDPVDGTSNFAIGVPFYSVSLALMIQGEVVAGLVYDPSRDELFSARKGLGAFINQKPLVASTSKNSLKQCSGIIDFKRLPAQLAYNLITQCPYSSQRSFGSVALDWCWIAAGRGQLYLHGAQNIWDYAAGWLILQEAGGQSSTLNNESVLVPRIEKRFAVAASNKALFTAWLNTLKDYSQT